MSPLNLEQLAIMADVDVCTSRDATLAKEMLVLTRRMAEWAAEQKAEVEQLRMRVSALENSVSPPPIVVIEEKLTK